MRKLNEVKKSRRQPEERGNILVNKANYHLGIPGHVSRVRYVTCLNFVYVGCLV